MRISLLHTADVHAQTFERIFDEIDPKVVRTHVVRTDLLDRARDAGLTAVRDETLAALTGLSSADAVICTCSTLGPLADELSRSVPHVFRIDRPVMENACGVGENVLVAICLESTRGATLALLKQCAAELGQPIVPEMMFCESAWAHFERGDMDGYAAEIATAVQSRLSKGPKPDCIVLAQASMRVAEDLLQSCGVPVMSSPVPAAERGIVVAREQMSLRP